MNLPSSLNNAICWSPERIEDVFNVEAVKIDQAIFLATHTPMNNLIYGTGPAQPDDNTEETLLNGLYTRAERNLHTFAIVKGMPGSGKSHLIRWLYERYRATTEEQHQGDVVILIERSSNNLHETLRQITVAVRDLKSEVFRQHRQRLENATTQLSEMGLADSLINNLQVADREQIADSLFQQLPPLLRQREHIRLFLLDAIVRDYLTREGGPIQRIMKGFNGRQVGAEDASLFQPDDFMFSDVSLSNIRRDSRHSVKDLAQALTKGSVDHREGMAEYLNELLRKFAIGKTIALTTGELRDIFFDIRRELYREGRGLALFIEDITTFTGLDEGLMEVLVTQHTGDTPQFCRLLSIIGITDQYFKANLPDNIKQRATYQINLSETTLAGNKTGFLTDAVVREMVARYMNALRLPQPVLERWRSAQALASTLPNACEECPVMRTCHAAFGMSSIETSHSQHEIGLYPFNSNMIKRLFDGIEDEALRTPRGLIQYILQYILQNNSELIVNGQFPPPLARLTGVSKPPGFRNRLQLPLLDVLSPTDRERVKTLLVYWGDQTLNSRQDEHERILGGLSSTVFDAFSIPMIAGDESNLSAVQTKPVEAAFPAVGSRSELSSKFTPSESANTVTGVRPPNPFHAHIDAWLNGERLRKANEMGNLLADFAKEYVDWDSYAIPFQNVNDRIKGRYFMIEGQDTKPSSDYLEFKRSDGLAQALYAVTEVGDKARWGTIPLPDRLGYLSQVINWLRDEEPRIIAFVSQPSGFEVYPVSLLTMQTWNILMLITLGGGMTASEDSPRALFLRLLKSSDDVQGQGWQKQMGQINRLTQRKQWVQLMGVLSDDVRGAVEDWLNAVNCPQGSSSKISYIDSAAVLDIIERFNRADWALDADMRIVDRVDELSKYKITHPMWYRALRLFHALGDHFQHVLDKEHEELQKLQTQFQHLLGESSPQEAFAAIDQTINRLKDLHSPLKFEQNTDLTARKLVPRLEDLQVMVALEGTKNRALSYSSSRKMDELTDYTVYFQEFSEEIENRLRIMQNKLLMGIAISQEGTQVNDVERGFANAIQTLVDLIASPNPANSEEAD